MHQIDVALEHGIKEKRYYLDFRLKNMLNLFFNAFSNIHCEYP